MSIRIGEADFGVAEMSIGTGDRDIRRLFIERDFPIDGVPRRLLTDFVRLTDFFLL
jgi:hypothetical protein